MRIKPGVVVRCDVAIAQIQIVATNGVEQMTITMGTDSAARVREEIDVALSAIAMHAHQPHDDRPLLATSIEDVLGVSAPRVKVGDEPS